MKHRQDLTRAQTENLSGLIDWLVCEFTHTRGRPISRTELERILTTGQDQISRSGGIRPGALQRCFEWSTLKEIHKEGRVSDGELEVCLVFARRLNQILHSFPDTGFIEDVSIAEDLGNVSIQAFRRDTSQAALHGLKQSWGRLKWELQSSSRGVTVGAYYLRGLIWGNQIGLAIREARHLRSNLPDQPREKHWIEAAAHAHDAIAYVDRHDPAASQDAIIERSRLAQELYIASGNNNERFIVPLHQVKTFAILALADGGRPEALREAEAIVERLARITQPHRGRIEADCANLYRQIVWAELLTAVTFRLWDLGEYSQAEGYAAKSQEILSLVNNEPRLPVVLAYSAGTQLESKYCLCKAYQPLLNRDIDALTSMVREFEVAGHHNRFPGRGSRLASYPNALDQRNYTWISEQIITSYTWI